MNYIRAYFKFDVLIIIVLFLLSFELILKMSSNHQSYQFEVVGLDKGENGRHCCRHIATPCGQLVAVGDCVVTNFETSENGDKSVKVFKIEDDAVVGNTMQELKDQGVHDDTLITLTTDNGCFHGEHRLADEWPPHQESTRVPLVAFDPRIDENKKGKPNNDFTSNIDLAPTMLSTASIEIPSRKQGRDMSQLHATTSKSAK